MLKLPRLPCSLVTEGLALLNYSPLYYISTLQVLFSESHNIVSGLHSHLESASSSNKIIHMIDRSHFFAGTGLRFTCSYRLLAKGSLSSRNWPQVLAMWLLHMNFIFSKAVEYPLSSWWRQRLIQHNITGEWLCHHLSHVMYPD